MSDNVAITAGSGTTVAADEATYSGDTAKVQLVRFVHVSGAEGSKTVSELVRLEDAAHTSGDPGIPAFAVRKDTAAALAGTDADYTPLITDATGRLWVHNESLGAVSDSAWASGNGTLVSLLKTIATASLDTSPVSVRTPCDVITVTPTLDTSAYASGDTLFATTAISGAVRANDERAVLMSVAVVDKDDQKPALRLLFFKANVTFGTANAAPSISDSDAANYLGHVDIAAADYVDLGGVSVACAKAINLLLESATGTTTVYVAAMLTAGTPTHTAAGLVFSFGLVQS